MVDRLSAVQIKPSHDALRKEAQDLEAQIRQIQDALDTLLRIQQKAIESALYNKANELQEDVSLKRFDLRVAQLHLAAINRQVGRLSCWLCGGLWCSECLGMCKDEDLVLVYTVVALKVYTIGNRVHK